MPGINEKDKREVAMLLDNLPKPDDFRKKLESFSSWGAEADMVGDRASKRMTLSKAETAEKYAAAYGAVQKGVETGEFSTNADVIIVPALRVAMAVLEDRIVAHDFDNARYIADNVERNFRAIQMALNPDPARSSPSQSQAR